MKVLPYFALAVLTASPAITEETRQLDAHEHGVGQLDIAFDGDQIAMELHAPGADIVGFEYAAESAEDRGAIDTAVATLAKPLDLFQFPAAAGCGVVQAAAELESEEEHAEHAEHDHDDHAEEAEHAEHDHDDHAEEAEHAEHDHDDHAEEAEHAEHDHDDHAKEEEHAEHDHDDHAEEAEHAEHDHDDHDEHADDAGHTEFHAEYLLTCADPSAITEITFAYFDVFPNALEVELQVITDAGATAFEVERDAPVLDLRSMF